MHLFSGDDSFASYNAAKELLHDLSAAKQAEVVILDGEELRDPAELLRHAGGLSLFAIPSVVFLKRALANSELTRFIHDNLANLSDADIVMWSDRKADGRLALVKTLAKQKQHSDFSLGKAWEIEKWFNAELSARKLKVNSQQKRYILQRIGHDKWLLASLIDKLELSTLGSEGGISDVDLAVLVGSDAQGDIWKFLDSLGSKSKAEALGELDKLTRFEDNTQYIIAMLTRELGLLAKVLEIKNIGGDFSQLKLHPFVLDKARSKVERFNWQKLTKLYQALFRLDLAVKQGRLDALTGLTMFVLSW